VLVARWRIVDQGGKEVTMGTSRLTESSGRDYDGLVAAHSRLIGTLSAEIADALRQGVRVTSRHGE
jgi:uncharacterized lipoprotein YmbA